MEDGPVWANQEFAAGFLGNYNMTMTSATLNTLLRALPVAVNTCLANIFGVIGSICTVSHRHRPLMQASRR